MSLEIDTNINSWISNFDLEKDKDQLNILLDIGFRVSKSMRFQDNTPSQIKEYMNNQSTMINNSISLIDNKINNLAEIQKNNLENINHRSQIMEHNLLSTMQEHKVDSINERERYMNFFENMTGKSKTSSIKGKIAENFLEETIRYIYPNYTLDVTAQTGHEADMQLYSPASPKILIESKNYSNTVPSKEITKFKNDLIRVNSNYGVFFSFNSKITSKDNMEIEKFDNKIILYVSGIEFSAEIVNLSITTIIYLSKQENYQKYISHDVLSKKTSEILSIVNSLNDICTSLTKTKYTLLEERKKISVSVDNIYTAYIENEIVMKNIIDKIQNDINIKISEVNNIPNKISNLDIENLLDDTNRDLAQKILTKVSMLNNCNISPKSQCQFQITNNVSEIISEINIGKTKCKLTIIPINCIISISKSDITPLDTYVTLLENL